jgi:hypothetical protein
MKEYLPIENESGYVKDPYSSAILYNDLSGLAEVKQKRKQTRQILTMQEEINMLKEEIIKIKSQLNLS